MPWAGRSVTFGCGVTSPGPPEPEGGPGDGEPDVEKDEKRGSGSGPANGLWAGALNARPGDHPD